MKILNIIYSLVLSAFSVTMIAMDQPRVIRAIHIESVLQTDKIDNLADDVIKVLKHLNQQQEVEETQYSSSDFRCKLDPNSKILPLCFDDAQILELLNIGLPCDMQLPLSSNGIYESIYHDKTLISNYITLFKGDNDISFPALKVALDEYIISIQSNWIKEEYDHAIIFKKTIEWCRPELNLLRFLRKKWNLNAVEINGPTTESNITSIIVPKNLIAEFNRLFNFK